MGNPTTLDRPAYCRKAVASFLLGGVAIGVSLMPAEPYGPVGVVISASILLSVLLGIHARRQIRTSSRRMRGSCLAAWGIGMASVGTVLVLFCP